MPNVATDSEQWFDEYLVEHGYTYLVEPDLGVQRRPDRLTARASNEALCEVKEFTTDAMRRRFPSGESHAGVFGAEEWFLTVRRTISSAAWQLEPLAADGRPLVILLANPLGVGVPLDSDELIQAMYGDLTLNFDVSRTTGAAVSEPAWRAGANGRLADGQAPWVSAVGRIRRRDRELEWQREWIVNWKTEHESETSETYNDAFRLWQTYTAELERAKGALDVPTGVYFSVDMIETIGDTAVRLPSDMFDGDGDRRWAFDPELSALVRVR
ncbi:MAG: hypothetical protein MSC30_04200 [Gaiellaceae bacterium MAG52_C11]|nr:hypothetical protein [Candidatus Gaiellasilicea maunaloa]